MHGVISWNLEPLLWSIVYVTGLIITYKETVYEQKCWITSYRNSTSHLGRIPVCHLAQLAAMRLPRDSSPCGIALHQQESNGTAECVIQFIALEFFSQYLVPFEWMHNAVHQIYIYF